MEMKQKYFRWSTFVKESHPVLPMESVQELFLLDVEQNSVWITEKIANQFDGGEDPLPPQISVPEFEAFLSDASRAVFRQELERMIPGNEERVSFHADIHGKNGYLSSVIYLFRVSSGKILGFLSVDYEASREYDRHLERVIQELRRVQSMNQLILEGASDYIYQLDIVNNVCTFSPNALDVLPLETATFSDAMNRVLSFIIPEDRPVFLDSFTPFLTGKSDLHIAEYRVRTKQGNIMWISCKGKGRHDAQGRPLMIAGSLLDITENKKHEEDIHRMLYKDMLTGLKNRRCFEMDMKEYLKKPGMRGSLLYMDIRKFKLYNELFGHDFGNRVLKEFAYMLQLYFADALGIYRFSGDEFLVHLKEYSRKEILAKLVAFQTNLKKTREIDGNTLYIGMYAAVVIYPEHGSNVEELMKNADQCLYRMSREENEEVCFFAGDMGDAVSLQFRLENELRKDIEHDYRHFRVVYQPIVQVDEQGEEWIGAEALLRYENPQIPDVDQMNLIRTLEYSGLILPVGRWVISKAVQECSQWNAGGKKVIVHVNVAAQQAADAGLVRYIRKCCETYGLPKSCLMVELTETSMLNSFEIATQCCQELMKMGVGVALDDFGTGYSSFNYLRNLPISQIKVDREYTRQLPANHYNQIIVSSLYRLAEDLEIELCVEGVETEDELKILREMGVSMIQGFYFERPLEADVIRREFTRERKL